VKRLKITSVIISFFFLAFLTSFGEAFLFFGIVIFILSMLYFYYDDEE